MQIRFKEIYLSLSAIAIASSCLTFFALSHNETRTPASSARVKACVLYYDRAEMPALAEFSRYVGDRGGFVFVPNAKADDLVKCVLQNDPEELLIFAPTFQSRNGDAKLGYFSAKTSDEKDELYARRMAHLQNQRKTIVSQNGFRMCTAKPCSEVQNKERNVRLAINQLRFLKSKKSAYNLKYGYDKMIFEDTAFDGLLSLRKTAPLNLKKIRLMSTDAQRVYQNFPSLQELVNTERVLLDISRPGKISTWLLKTIKAER